MMKLSTILADAADMLCRGEHDYSCNAAGFAYGRAKTGCKDKYELPQFIPDGFLNMGMSAGAPGMPSVQNFHNFRNSNERRNARILWLLWAALMAREQGL